MKGSSKIIFFLVCMTSMVLLSGCNKYQEMEGREVTDYLSERYGGKFEIVSVEQKDRCDRDYLDAEMEKLNEKNSDVNEDKDYIYTIKDENGVEFHLVGFKMYGFGSYYRYTDDYCVQAVKAKDTLDDALDALGFPYTYYNEIGYYDSPQAYFEVEIANFADVAGVVTDIYEMLTDEAFITPYKSYPDEEYSVYGVRPTINVTSQGIEIWRMYFPEVEDDEMDSVEYQIRLAERNYADKVREGSIKEELATEVLLTYGPRTILDVSYQGKDVPICLYNAINYLEHIESDDYMVADGAIKKDNLEERVYYEELCILLSAVGYKTVFSEDAVTWTKDGNVVTIAAKGYEYSCTHNGEKYVAEGSISHSMKLTEKDMQELFGIRYQIDKIAETAEIICFTK